MATATTMYHSSRNPLTRVRRQMRDEAEESVDIVRGEKRRRLHKAFLRYLVPFFFSFLREALKAMGRADLIGNGKHHLIPTFRPLTDGAYQSARRKNSTPTGAKGATAAPVKQVKLLKLCLLQKGRMLTQHAGLPPRVTGAAKPSARKPR